MTELHKNILAAGGCTALLGVAAFAGVFTGAPSYYPNMAAYRIGAMLAATGLGFGLGWLLSPQTTWLRTIILATAAAALFLKAAFDNNPVGWWLTYLTAIIGFACGLGYWLRSVTRKLGEVPNTFGSAKWADARHLWENKVLGRTGFHLGYFPTDKGLAPLHYEGDRHLLTVSPTRSGKGATMIIPNLLTYTGSALVIDPKGENAMVTSEHRAAMGQAIHIVDPWGIAMLPGQRPARFNPLDWLDAGDIDITENAMLLADALAVKEGDNDPFWSEEAKALLQGIILFVATDEDEQASRHLGRVRDLLLLDGEDMPALFQRMVQSEHRVVASCGARCLQKEEKLLANVIASAQAQTHFFDSPRVRESLSVSDFRFEDLKTSPMTVYLVLPADRLAAFGRWLRLLIQQAITVNARNIERKPERPVLFMLDEMAALGRLTMVEQAYGLMAGFGLQLWGIVQDFSQLEAIYGKGWQTFVSNSGVLQYFGSRDQVTADYFSALCGVTTVWNFSTALARTFSHGPQSSGSESNTDTTAAAQRKLAYPDELMRIEKSRQLLLIENLDPIRAKRRSWFTDPKLSAIGRNLQSQ